MNLPGPLPPAEQAHCRRTAALSELLAKLAGFPDSEVRTVTQSALVHDIGKTAIPASILCKPGPLTAEECAIMRMHTAVGAHSQPPGGHDAQAPDLLFRFGPGWDVPRL